ncbi:hypothetical protein L195_g010718, partial [Trifolium pratense]
MLGKTSEMESHLWSTVEENSKAMLVSGIHDLMMALIAPVEDILLTLVELSEETCH